MYSLYACEMQSTSNMRPGAALIRPSETSRQTRSGTSAFILARARDSSRLNARHYIARSEPIYRELVLPLSTQRDTSRDFYCTQLKYHIFDQ